MRMGEGEVQRDGTGRNGVRWREGANSMQFALREVHCYIFKTVHPENAMLISLLMDVSCQWQKLNCIKIVF